MRRGLMMWRNEELSNVDLERRIARLRAVMASENLDAFIAYGNFVRPQVIAHLTGFTQFWGDGLLVVCPDGRPTYFSVLTNRSNSWIAGLNPVCEIVHTPNLGTAVADHLNTLNRTAVGIGEYGSLPERIASVLSQKLKAPPVEAGHVFAKSRETADGAEINLMRRADGLAAAGIQQVPSNAKHVGDVVSAVELAVRLGGCEDCHIAVAPNMIADARLARHRADTLLGDVFAVRASVVRHGVLSRRTRTYAVDAKLARKLSCLEAAIATWCETEAPDRRAALPLIDDVEWHGWCFETPSGSYQLQTVDPHREGERHPYGVMTLRGTIEGNPWIVTQMAVGSPPAVRDASSE